MKKLTLLLLCLFVLSFTVACSAVKESPIEDFLYEMINGEVTITGYIGSDQEIYIPSIINERPVTAVGKEAFAGYDLKHITIPATVTEIGESAFYNCACLVSVDMPDSLRIIDRNAFSGCVALQSLILPEKLEHIYDGAYSNCGLQEITLPSNLKSLGAGTFASCKALQHVNLPDTLERIEENTFSGCGLKEVSLPVNLKYLGTDAFAFCENLTSLAIPDNTEIAISVYKQNAGYDGYVTFFNSPVGGSYIVTYYDEEINNTIGEQEYKQLSTIIIVHSGSYAYQQVTLFTEYGLTIEVE